MRGRAKQQYLGPVHSQEYNFIAVCILRKCHKIRGKYVSFFLLCYRYFLSQHILKSKTMTQMSQVIPLWIFQYHKLAVQNSTSNTISLDPIFKSPLFTIKKKKYMTILYIWKRLSSSHWSFSWNCYSTVKAKEQQSFLKSSFVLNYQYFFKQLLKKPRKILDLCSQKKPG